MTSRSTTILTLLLAGTVAVAAQAPVGNTRVDAFFRALASGNTDIFEAMAKEHFEAAMLARRTPADRKQMVERVKADFGQMTLDAIDRRADGPVKLRVRGTTGLLGTIELTLGPLPEERISRVGIQIGGDPADDNAPPPPPVAATMTPVELTAALDRYLEPLVASGAFSGVVLVARAGVPVYEKAFGLADRAQKTANTPSTRFSLGSINKVFTQTAVAQLVAQGRLKPSDTLGALLPDYPQAGSRSATIDQLLSHQAGIADFFGPVFDQSPKTQFRSNADYYRLVGSLPALFAPGARRQYCNGCYIVLGAIIEKVSGMSYEDYVARHIYAPAGMATAGPTGAGAARGYTTQSPGGPVPLQSNVTQHGLSGSAAGGGYATARDLLNFDEALRAGRLADATGTARLLQVDQVTPGRSAGGLGIAGGAPGINAVLESSQDWTVIALANLDPPAAGQLGTAIHSQLSR